MECQICLLTIYQHNFLVTAEYKKRNLSKTKYRDAMTYLADENLHALLRREILFCLCPRKELENFEKLAASKIISALVSNFFKDPHKLRQLLVPNKLLNVVLFIWLFIL